MNINKLLKKDLSKTTFGKNYGDAAKQHETQAGIDVRTGNLNAAKWELEQAAIQNYMSKKYDKPE